VACGISRLARYNVTALSEKTGKVTDFEGAPIPTSVVLVLFLVLVTRASRIGDALPFGSLPIGGGVHPLVLTSLHPLVLTFVISGSLLISETLLIPKL
jgi:CDP-diacylglycerol--serine O-phosphatidyltransferase